jgi:hypothetical protein
MKKSPPITYEAECTPIPGSIIDGSMRRISKVTLMRFDKPTAKGVKCGSETVRAWTALGLRREEKQAADRLMKRDQAKRRNEIHGRIDRIIAAHRLS